MNLNLTNEQAIARDVAELLARKRYALQHALNLAARLGASVPVMFTATINPKDETCTINMSFEKPSIEFVADNIKTQLSEEPK